MKKLALLVAVAGIVGLSSCGKDGAKECTNTINGVKSVITISKSKIKTCTGGNCVETDNPSTASLADQVKALETAGYTCK